MMYITVHVYISYVIYSIDILNINILIYVYILNQINEAVLVSNQLKEASLISNQLKDTFLEQNITYFFIDFSVYILSM